MKAFAAALALSALMLAAVSAVAAAAADPTARAQRSAPGGIRGRLVLAQAPRSNERRPEVASPGAGGFRERTDRRAGVVYLEQAPRGAFDEPVRVRAVMDQQNERFEPHLLAVTVGTMVEFPNSDRTYHNVFSLSRAKRFDLGRYATGKSKSVLMDRPGVVRVFCDIHSHMNAFVLVFAHPFFDVTEPDGRYELANVPPGSYTVVGWHEGEPRVERAVTVSSGSWVELDLSAP
ncbi:MAG TPA: carboxypeptidase regulatory-like domain-containing protein [Vicinamibacterales bacterium]|jgi:plastocyanin|nr:carboxypeptidase regulatory-like domain-containing protein [Vicinamibacterales bacterium]